MPKAKYFEKARPARSTTPPSTCSAGRRARSTAANVLANIIGCRDADGKGGAVQLRRLLQSEDRRADRARSWSRPTPSQARRADRRGLPDRCTRRSASSRCTSRRWPGACRKKVKIVQRADNQILLYWVDDAVAHARDAGTTAAAGRAVAPPALSPVSTCSPSPSAGCFEAAFVMLTVALIAFALFRFVGDPVNQMVGQDTTLEDRAELRAASSASTIPSPCSSRRFVWQRRCSFDFGISYQFKQPVTAHDRRALPGHLRAGARRRPVRRSRSASRWASTPASTATAGCRRCS